MIAELSTNFQIEIRLFEALNHNHVVVESVARDVVRWARKRN